jgi:hypothetical protein
MYYFPFCIHSGGSRLRSWLRHFDTSRKVVGSIPDGATGIFHKHNPSGRAMALGSTQNLTEMSTRNIMCACMYVRLYVAYIGMYVCIMHTHTHTYICIYACMYAPHLAINVYQNL